MLPAKYFRHINETEPFSLFVNGKVLPFLYHMSCGYHDKASLTDFE